MKETELLEGFARFGKISTFNLWGHLTYKR